MPSANPKVIRHSQSLTGAQVMFLAVAAGVATSTSYTVQPELISIAKDLGASLATTSAAAGLPILGYMIGLALLVPLVDHLPARRLVSAQMAALGLSLPSSQASLPSEQPCWSPGSARAPVLR
jgi:predicted MFS family arabinose efflux permease